MNTLDKKCKEIFRVENFSLEVQGLLRADIFGQILVVGCKGEMNV